MQISLRETIKNNINIIIFFTIAVFIAYGPSLTNQFVWDDEQFIYNNIYVKTADVQNIFTQNTVAGAGESSTYYRPLTTLSFAIDHAIWGLNPLGYHLTNTLLHLGAGIFLFAFLRNLKFSKYSSIFIATIFLLHPLQTEAVVYANSRGDSMYTFFAFLSILLFSLVLKNKSVSTKIYDLEIILSKRFFAIGALLSYVLSVFSKEIGIASIGLLGITLGYWLTTHSKKIEIQKILRKKTLEIGVVIAGFASAIAYIFFRSHFISISNSQTNYYAGTAYGESVYVRLHTFTQALWKYFELIIYPYPLHMERNIPIIESPFSLYLLATIFLVLTVVLLVAIEYKKYKSSQLAFGVLWFIGMLIPVSGIVPVNGLIYEHWLYTPIVGFCIAMHAVLRIIFSKKQLSLIYTGLRGFFPILIIVYIVLTIRQNYFWSTPVRFYNYTLQFTQSARLRNNLAMAYAAEKDYESAIENYHKAIEISDYYPQTRFNLGNSYAAIGAYELAKDEYLAAIKMNENFMPAYSPLIQLLIQFEDFENAANLLESLQTKNPSNVDIQILHAQVLLELDEKEKAASILEQIDTSALPTQMRFQIKDLLLQIK